MLSKTQNITDCFNLRITNLRFPAWKKKFPTAMQLVVSVSRQGSQPSFLKLPVKLSVKQISIGSAIR